MHHVLHSCCNQYPPGKILTQLRHILIVVHVVYMRLLILFESKASDTEMPWPINGQPLVNQWSATGQSMVNQSMVNQWSINGQSMVKQSMAKQSTGTDANPCPCLQCIALAVITVARGSSPAKNSILFGPLANGFCTYEIDALPRLPH